MCSKATKCFIDRMRRLAHQCARWLPLGLLAVVASSLLGCATNEPGNASARPWNSPKGWEHSLPPEIMEGR